MSKVDGGPINTPPLKCSCNFFFLPRLLGLISVENGAALLFYVKHKIKPKTEKVKIQQDARQYI